MGGYHEKRFTQQDILEILKKYTDQDHKLSQNAIRKRLNTDYDIKVDRKTVCSHLLTLLDADNEHIKYKEDVTRTKADGQTQEIMSNWFYQSEFSEGELRFLIDSVLFCDALSDAQRKALIAKLEGLTNQYFHSIIGKIDLDVYNRLENSEFMATIQTIENGIAEEKQIAFCYRHCGIDAKPHLRLNEDGSAKRYIVNPYQLIHTNGHAYLVCNVKGHDDLTHFRLDRIVQCEKLTEDLRPLRRLDGWKEGMRLSEYLAQHPTFWSSKKERVYFLCPQYLMNDVVDAFGTGVMITEKPDGMMRVSVSADTESVLHWAMQFVDTVEIISPKPLRDKMTGILEEALKRYKKK